MKKRVCVFIILVLSVVIMKTTFDWVYYSDLPLWLKYMLLK